MRIGTTPATEALAHPTRHGLCLLSGAGFAPGFGWLWFSPLQEFWLPEFLWGRLFSGGGASLFVALLCLCFPLAGLFFRQRAKAFLPDNEHGATDDFRTGKNPHLAHGLALALAGGALAANRSGLPWLTAACIALAGVILGLYWMSALLALPGRQILAAFASACGFSVLLALLHTLAPDEAEWLLLCEFLAAWLAAVGLGWVIGRLRLESDLLRLKTPEPKRPRGRPAQNLGPAKQPPGPEALSRHILVLPVLAFFLTGLAHPDYLHDSGGHAWQPLSSWIAMAFGFGGALLARFALLPAGRARSSAPLAAPAPFLCAVLAAQALVLLLAPALLPAALAFVEGAVCGALLFLLAAVKPGVFLPSPAFQASARLRAALVLACAVLSTHAGLVLAQAIRLLCADHPHPDRLAAAWAGGFILLLTAALAAMIRLGLYRAAPGRSSGMEEMLVILTEREYAVAELVIQGLSNKDIAAALYISEETVRFHLKNIYQKTGLSDRLRGAAP